MAALALAGALAVPAWTRVLSPLLEGRSFTDGERARTMEGVRYAVWDEPEELLASPAVETRPALSSDGRWLVFASGEVGLGAELVLAEIAGGSAQEPRPLAELNSPADEIAPSFGEGELLFASNRPGGAGGFDLYRARFSTRAGAGFGAPERIAEGAQTPSDELDPARAPDGALWFASNRTGNFDLYRLAPGESEPSAAPGLQSPRDEREPSFAGAALFFASSRKGHFDLYKSLRGREGWLPPRALSGLATELDERSPLALGEGFELLFARGPCGPSADLDLYRARSLELYLLPGAQRGWSDLAAAAALLLLALLAWLSGRWSALEPIWKCYLASLLIHALLLLLSRCFSPEGEAPLPRAGEPGTHRVRLLQRELPSARLAERGGGLEVARAELEEAGPARLEQEGAQADLRAIARPLSAPAGDTATPPASAPAALARPAARAVEPDLDPREQAAGRRSLAAAPEIELAPASISTVRRPAAASPGRASSAAASTALSRLAPPAPAPIGAPVAALAVGPPFEVSSADRALEPASAPATRVAVAAPRESPESTGRRALGAAAGPSLSAAEFEAKPASSGGAPERAELAPRLARAETQGPGPARIAAPSRAEDGAPPSREALAERASPSGGPGSVVNGLALRGEETGEERRPVAAPPAAEGLPVAAGFSRGSGDPEGDSSSEPRRLAAAEDRPVPAERPLPRPIEAPPREREGPPPARLEETPYRARFGEEKAVALRVHGGGEDTERAVQLGLEYLARIQRPDGSWGDAEDRHGKYRDVRIGKAGLCLLAFLGAGHVPRGDTRFAGEAGRAVDFLLRSQDARGDGATGHFGDCEAYGHGIAAYALGECYALTREEGLRAPLERAIARILATQLAGAGRGIDGGWSYFYPDGSTFDRWPRASITAWQVMALESARLGGLDVPDQAFERARRFLVESWDGRLGAFRYSHDPSRLGSEYATLPGSTPAALFALSLLGEDLAGAAWRRGVEFVSARAPRGYRMDSESSFVFEASGNLYFWYYASLALLRLGGERWERWNVGLKDTLLPAQEEDGSWAPIDVYARYAGDGEDERSYTTAMCVLSLEVYYRYFTPLLQVR